MTPVLKALNCFPPLLVLGLLELGGVVVKDSKSENLASNPEDLGGDMLALLVELPVGILLPRNAILWETEKGAVWSDYQISNFYVNFYLQVE